MSKNDSSRRDFLKGSAALGAGAALGSLSIARTAHAAAGGRLKLALIGCGGRGTGAASDMLSVAEDVELVALADAFEDRAQGALGHFRKNFAEKTKIAPDRVFAGLDAYEKALACGVDLVILAEPPGFRPSHYKAAVEAGKHVFMEKPCCTDAPGYRTLLETNKAADAKGLKVGVGLQRRHQSGYIGGVQEIQDGRVGDFVLSRVYWNGGGIWFRDRTPSMTEMQYQVTNWYHFVWLSGDNICEQHVHNLDVGNWVKGDHPVRANGMGSCMLRYKNRDPKKGMGQIFDNHFVEFTYKDGTKMYSQCRHIPNTWGGDGEKVHGTKGITGVGGRGPELKYGNPYQQEHYDLLAAIRKNDKYNEGWHGATSSFTAVLGRMANYSGQEVSWDEAVARGPSEFPDRLAWDAPPKALPDEQGNYPIAIPGQYRAY
ncbi:MAG: Gfo/Idh/MocA family oxidoreductase [Thermoguttaceae bacterium]|jgi:predicted dehydrogenase